MIFYLVLIAWQVCDTSACVSEGNFAQTLKCPSARHKLKIMVGMEMSLLPPVSSPRSRRSCKLDLPLRSDLESLTW